MLLLNLPCLLYGQDRQVDSLLQELKKAGSDQRQRASVQAELALKMLAFDVAKAKAYARKAVDLAKAGGYEPELAKAYVNLGYALSASGHTEDAYALADSGWQLASKHNVFETKFFSQALMGGSKRKMAKYDEALHHYMHAAKIAESGNDKRILGKAYNILGVFYVTTRDLSRAEAYHKKALEVRLQTNDYGEIFQSYDNLGIVHRELKQYDKALAYYFKAAEYAIKGEDSSDISFVYNDIGAAYSFQGDLNNAEQYLKESISIRERMNETNEIAYTYNYLGENYERKKDYLNAERYIKKALATAISTQNNKQTYEAYESLSDFFARNNRFDSAYKYAMQHNNFKDSITKIDQGKIIAELNTKFETAQKERLIQQQQHQITRRNYWIAGIAALLAMGTSIGYSRRKRMKLQQQAALQTAILHQQELATKAILEAEENERKRIATDLHDGVGQMMSAAKLNLSSLRTDMQFTQAHQQQAFDNAVALVDDSCKEVRNVSHNIMPNSLLKSGLASAIREFINKIDSRVMKVNLYTEGLGERLDTNVETVLYRIVQECVNNVIKHADANTLDITLIKDEEDISVTIEDNGKGFDATEGTEGMGLKNVRTRAEFLKGNVEWHSAPGKGTVVMVHVPRN
jgi:two-component system, NarL family, sensor kinase